MAAVGCTAPVGHMPVGMAAAENNPAGRHQVHTVGSDTANTGSAERTLPAAAQEVLALVALILDSWSQGDLAP